MSLVLRKRKDGTVHPMKELPDSHEFSARWIDRAVGSGLVSVRITLHLGDEDKEYEFTGFPVVGEKDGEPVFNFTGWQCEAVEEGE